MNHYPPTQEDTMYAHYFQGYVLITTSADLSVPACIVKRIDVQGKRQARKVAAWHTATPWNF
jgi:hypothetical protein